MNAQEFAPGEHWKSTLTMDRDTATDTVANDSNAGANHAKAAKSYEVLYILVQRKQAANQHKMRQEGRLPHEFGLSKVAPTDVMRFVFLTVNICL